MLLSKTERALICYIYYTIVKARSPLDCVNRIYHFFKLLALNLNTVAVHNNPICSRIFFCQLSQLIFSNAKILCRFFYCKGIFLPDRDICLIHLIAPLSQNRYSKSYDIDIFKKGTTGWL